ncbi:hypothetical protein Tco_1475458 [Tanacetum coccineum]
MSAYISGRNIIRREHNRAGRANTRRPEKGQNTKFKELGHHFGLAVNSKRSYGFYHPRIHGTIDSGSINTPSFTAIQVLKFSPRTKIQVILPGSVEGGGPEVTNDREETPPPLTKEQIEGHVSALKSLIKSHNQRNKEDPIRLDFESKDTEVQDLGIAKGKRVMDEDLGKPFKEARRTLLTRRIIEFAGPEYKMPANIKLYDNTTDPEDHLSRFASAANSGEWPMPVWCRMFQQTLDGSVRGWFKRLPHDSINEWADLREAFAARYSVRRACFKEPYEITKIVMKISSFMDAVKSPELAKRFSNKVPTMLNEMMDRLDDFVRSEEAYARTKLPKGEMGETHHKTSLVFNRRDNQSSRNTHPRESRRNEYRNNYRSVRDAYLANRTRDDRAPYPPPRGEYNHRVALVLSLEYLTKRPKEILATETQLHLPAPSKKAVGDGVGVKKVESLGEGYTTEMKGIPRQRGSPTRKGDQCDQCKFGKRQKTEGERDDGAMNEHPNILSSNILGGRFRGLSKRKDTWSEGYTWTKGRLCMRTSMKFVVVRAPSPYNIILGRPGLKTLRAIPSTIHSMMKFPTPKGVATLVTRAIIINEYRRLEKKQMIKESSEGEREVAATKEVLVNPSFPDQRVTIGGRLSETCREQLKCLLKDNMGVFAWEPSVCFVCTGRICQKYKKTFKTANTDTGRKSTIGEQGFQAKAKKSQL